MAHSKKKILKKEKGMLWCFSGSRGNYDIVGGFPPIRTLILILRLISVQPPSCVRIFVTPWNAARQASLSFAISRSLLKLMSVELVMPSNHLTLCRPLLLSPPIFPSSRVFSNEMPLCIRWPKHWTFSFSIGPSNEYSGLIFFRMDWLHLLGVHRTLFLDSPALQADSLPSETQGPFSPR